MSAVEEQALVVPVAHEPPNSPLWAATLRASQAIEDNGTLRSALRRAGRVQDVIGYGSVDAFGKALKPVLAARHLDGTFADAIADGAMILMAQRNVAPFGQLDEAAAPGGDLLAQRLGEKLGERRRLSELRFQRLLRAGDVDDRMQQLRRAIALLEVPIHPLAVLHAWLDLHTEPGRRRFARAYFSGLFVPSQQPAEEQAAPASGSI